jgi:hypothetical protein
MEEAKDLAFYRANAEEDYMTTPISVLRYITELEKQKAPEMLEMLKYFVENNMLSAHGDEIAEQLIKEATEL